MEITDITLIAISSLVVLGSAIVIAVTNYRRCNRQPVQPVQPGSVETVIAWK